MKNKGITLVALVITIIILLILTGITISQLTGSGLFENAKLAEEKSKNAQEKEDGILGDYENQINGYLNNSREQIMVDKSEYEALKSKVLELDKKVNGMCSPKVLTSCNWNNNGTANAGTYNASTSRYIKTDSSDMSNYLRFEENVGWTVLKEGFYLIRASTSNLYINENATIYTKMYIREGDSTVMHGLTRDQVYDLNNGAQISEESMLVYLDANDVIDFALETDKQIKSYFARFSISAMFE